MNALVSKIGLLLFLAISVWGCLDAPNYPDIPYIEFIGISKDTLKQGIFQEDSLIVLFKFQDGDGDIGRTDQSDENDVSSLMNEPASWTILLEYPASPRKVLETELKEK